MAFEFRTDNRPTDYEYALMSKHVYDKPKKTDSLPQAPAWQVHKIEDGGLLTYGFFVALYRNMKTHQLVVAFRGASDNLTWVENFWGISMNSKETVQKLKAFKFVQEAIDYAIDEGYQLSFTGHSLGAYLAELAVYFCHYSFNYPFVNAVTFESPGIRGTIEKFQAQAHESLEVAHLDVASYLSYPNPVNTCNLHVGTLYTLHPELDKNKFYFFQKVDVLEVHSMDNILALFQNGILQGREYVQNWPSGIQAQRVFTSCLVEDHADEEGRLCYRLKNIEEFKSEMEVVKEQCKLDFKAGFKVDGVLSNFHTLPLRHFGIELQRFLALFYQQTVMQTSDGLNRVTEHLKEQGIPDNILKLLFGFALTKNERGLVYVMLYEKTVNMSEFRGALSNWLAENAEKAPEILSSLNGGNNNLGIEVNAYAIQDGAHLTIDAPSAKFTAIGIDVVLPDNADELAVRHVQQISASTLNRVVKINAVIFPAGTYEINSTGNLEFNSVGIRFGYTQPNNNNSNVNNQSGPSSNNNNSNVSNQPSSYQQNNMFSNNIIMEENTVKKTL